MFKLAIVLIILGYVASGCGKLPDPRDKISTEKAVTVCTINGVDVHSQSCCKEPWKVCEESSVEGKEAQI